MKKIQAWWVRLRREMDECGTKEVAAAIRMLAWCVFWGLVLHGCAVGNIVVRLGARQ